MWPKSSKDVWFRFSKDIFQRLIQFGNHTRQNESGKQKSCQRVCQNSFRVTVKRCCDEKEEEGSLELQDPQATNCATSDNSFPEGSQSNVKVLEKERFEGKEMERKEKRKKKK